jgi:hypothetical protein
MAAATAALLTFAAKPELATATKEDNAHRHLHDLS